MFARPACACALIGFIASLSRRLRLKGRRLWPFSSTCLCDRGVFGPGAHSVVLTTVGLQSWTLGPLSRTSRAPCSPTYLQAFPRFARRQGIALARLFLSLGRTYASRLLHFKTWTRFRLSTSPWVTSILISPPWQSSWPCHGIPPTRACLHPFLIGWFVCGFVAEAPYLVAMF